MRNQIRWALCLWMGMLLLAQGAEAAKKKKKKTGTRSPHHCMKAGVEVPGVHKRDCRAQGGKWLKLRPAPAK